MLRLRWQMCELLFEKPECGCGLGKRQFVVLLPQLDCRCIALLSLPQISESLKGPTESILNVVVVALLP